MTHNNEDPRDHDDDTDDDEKGPNRGVDDEESVKLEDLGLGFLSGKTGTLESFVKAPGAFIRTEVAGFIVGGLIGLSFDIAGAIGDGFDALASSLDSVREAVIDAFVGPGSAALSSLGELVAPISTFARDAGPLGWIVAIVLVAVIARVLADQIRRIGLGLLDAIPVVGSFIESYVR